MSNTGARTQRQINTSFTQEFEFVVGWGQGALIRGKGSCNIDTCFAALKFYSRLKYWFICSLSKLRMS